MGFDALDRLQQQQVLDKVALVISRHWDNPEIYVRVNKDQIELKIGIADLAAAVVSEVGPVWKRVSQKKYEESVRKAFADAVEKVKESSARVM